VREGGREEGERERERERHAVKSSPRDTIDAVFIYRFQSVVSTSSPFVVARNVEKRKNSGL